MIKLGRIECTVKSKSALVNICKQYDLNSMMLTRYFFFQCSDIWYKGQWHYHRCDFVYVQSFKWWLIAKIIQWWSGSRIPHSYFPSSGSSLRLCTNPATDECSVLVQSPDKMVDCTRKGIWCKSYARSKYADQVIHRFDPELRADEGQQQLIQ